MSYRSVVVVTVLVGLTKTRFGHHAILKILFQENTPHENKAGQTAGTGRWLYLFWLVCMS